MGENKYLQHKIVYSLLSILYVWSLPFLSYIGFAEKGTSISQFIANAHATGAMASVSLLPIVLMNDYIEMYAYDNSTLQYSLFFFEINYGLFLTCSINYVPILLHQVCVTLFSLSFLIYAYFINLCIEMKKITRGVFYFLDRYALHY